MKSRYIFDQGQVIYAEENGQVTIDQREVQNDAGFFVIPDCQPFQSMVDGTIINSKSQYRDHLRQHNAVEVGNDRSIMNPVIRPLRPPPGLKEELIRVAADKLRSR